MEERYHIVGKENTRELAKFLVKHGQGLLPMVELIEESKLAVDEMIDVLGRAQIEAVLRLSAERIAGPPHPGRKGGAIGWHGRERGTICLKERKLRIERPRLRKKGQGKEGEVAVPAFEAMRSNEKLGMTEKNFRRMMGYRDLWMLEAALGRKSSASPEKVA